MEFRCPHCNAPIYSRKQKFCGVCEKSLPPELLLSDKQITILKTQDEQMEKRAREFDPRIHDDSYLGSSGMI